MKFHHFWIKNKACTPTSGKMTKFLPSGTIPLRAIVILSDIMKDSGDYV
jgi:hypothetical protein